MFILCLIVALITNQLAHTKKEINRDRNSKIAVGLLLGFASTLLTLLFSKIIPIHWAILSTLISFSYTYFMADAKGFKNIK